MNALATVKAASRLRRSDRMWEDCILAKILAKDE
jgi:hypothetical protein